MLLIWSDKFNIMEYIIVIPLNKTVNEDSPSPFSHEPYY